MAVTKYDGKVAAITGAGSGMGRSLAVLLSRAGCCLSLSDVNETALLETTSLLDPAVKATTFTLDVADRAAVEACQP